MRLGTAFEKVVIPNTSPIITNAQHSEIARLLGVPLAFYKVEATADPRGRCTRWGNLIAMLMSDPKNCIAAPEWQQFNTSTVFVFRTDTHQSEGVEKHLLSIHNYICDVADGLCEKDTHTVPSNTFTEEVFQAFEEKREEDDGLSKLLAIWHR